LDCTAIDDPVLILRGVECAAKVDVGAMLYGAVLLGAKGREMDLTGPGLLHNATYIMGTNACAGEDLDSAVGMDDQLFDEFQTLWYGSCLTAGQHAFKSQVYELIQGRGGLGRYVECPVEDGLPASATADEFFTAFLVDRSVFMQHAEYDAIGPVFDCQLGITYHHGHFRVRVAETTSSGTNHDHYRNVRALFELYERSQGRCETAQEKR